MFSGARWIVFVGMLGAIAFILMATIQVPVMPSAPYLRYDPSDVISLDRYGQVRDPFGHVWAIATHKEDLTPEEAQRRSSEFFASMKA